MNRRTFIGTSAGASIGLVVLSQVGCSPKTLTGWVSTIVSAFGEIRPLLPQLGLSQIVIDRVGGWLDTAQRVAKKFNEAYLAGKFTDARALFMNLGELITSVAGELGAANNRIVKLALISISIARIAIATLLQGQAQASLQVMGAVNAAKAAGGADAKAIAEIERLAATDVSKILALLPR